MIIRKGLTIFFLFVATASAICQRTSSTSMKDFQHRRFGMFVHWGPVALRGTEIGWSRDKEVPKEEYDSLYKEFDPVLFDADAWVKTAKDAGMKYLIITARHHDGFCLWPTKFIDYNIMNTPYKKDIVGALNEACKKQGIKFGIYYSVLDWYHPDYPLHTSVGNPSPDPASDMNRYISYMKNQLKELITNYNPYILWFDGQWESPWTDDMGKDIYNYVKQLKPDIITNNRLGKEFASMANKAIDTAKMIGDYDTPEQVIGRMNMTMPWESNFTICDQWAWKPNDKMKSLKECLIILARTTGGNGNLLLNVGPMLDGRIEARQIKRLKEIGDWLRINGEAIYGTLGGPYEPNSNFATTRKGNTIYVQVLNTDTAAIALKKIPGVKILNAHILSGEKIGIAQTTDAIVINIPPALKGKIPFTVALELNKSAETIPIIK